VLKGRVTHVEHGCIEEWRLFRLASLERLGEARQRTIPYLRGVYWKQHVLGKPWETPYVDYIVFFAEAPYIFLWERRLSTGGKKPGVRCPVCFP